MSKKLKYLGIFLKFFSINNRWWLSNVREFIVYLNKLQQTQLKERWGDNLAKRWLEDTQKFRKPVSRRLKFYSEFWPLLTKNKRNFFVWMKTSDFIL
jgi:hypothetical protein